jgi:hypothetical protein
MDYLAQRRWLMTKSMPATLRGNAVGVDGNGPGMALFDAPDGPRFAIAEAAGRPGQGTVARHFSQGVIIAR